MLKKKKRVSFLTLLLLPLLLQAQADKPDYLQKLKEGGAYDTLQVQNFPEFTYQGKLSADLIYLRKTYHLDSIAGTGTDISKAINLLNWMHKTVPHEDEYNHKLLNAKNIIDIYKEKGIAQGCYPLAIAMNEIFLAMGYQSRVVICFSSDFEHPNGGHVLNSVYIPSLKKWIWMDPQYNAFLQDGQGNFLNIAEVRQRIINGQPVVLNADANYHGDPVKIDYYLYDFMLEHLYRFICPLRTEYNSETRSSGKTLTYIELLPAQGKIPVNGAFESHTANGTKVVTYHTNNPVVFWKIP